MIPIDLVFLRLIRATFEDLAKNDGTGLALWRQYFDGWVEFWENTDGVDADTLTERHWNHFRARVPKVEPVFPRGNQTTWPFISVVLEDEIDVKKFVGSVVGPDYETDDGKRSRVGAVEEGTVRIVFFSENVDEIRLLHQIVKAALRRMADGIKEYAGADSISFGSTNGYDKAPDVLPEQIIIRSQTWKLTGASYAVVGLGSTALRVYVHLRGATFTVDGDPEEGKVEAS